MDCTKRGERSVGMASNTRQRRGLAVTRTLVNSIVTSSEPVLETNDSPLNQQGINNDYQGYKSQAGG